MPDGRFVHVVLRDTLRGLTDLRVAGDHESLRQAFIAGERFECVPRPLATVGRGGRHTHAGRYRSEVRRTRPRARLDLVTNVPGFRLLEGEGYYEPFRIAGFEYSRAS